MKKVNWDNGPVNGTKDTAPVHPGGRVKGIEPLRMANGRNPGAKAMEGVALSKLGGVSSKPKVSKA